jgi:HK97 family phage major capsid protein
VPYNNIVSRTDASALIPEEVASEVIDRATGESAVLELFRRVPVGRAQVRMPILSALPIAYWVNGDTGIKQTTEVNWTNKFLNIEEIATIMPVPDNVVDDAEQDIWDEATPYLVEALGRTLDAAVFFGTDAPASFPTNIRAAATAAGNEVTESAAATAGGFFGDLDALIGAVEGDGYDVNGFVAARSARARFRTARNADGDRLDRDRIMGNLAELDGARIVYPMRGQFPSGGAAGTNVRMFAGDWTQFVVGVRKDVTMDVFREGVIQDNTGAIVYNLMQQDMTAIRVTFRVGWQVANPINFDQQVEANRYPAAVLEY